MAAPAVAADLSVAPIYKAPPTPPTNWTGTYIGLSGGGVWGNAKVYSGVTGLDETPWFDLSGGLVGLTAGTQFQNGQLGAGLRRRRLGREQAAAARSRCRQRSASTTRSRNAGSRPIAAGSASRNDNWLFYATAGGAMASLQQNITAPAACRFLTRNWHWGWTAGAGVEVKINQDWSAKVEYLYVGLQDKSYFNPSPNAAVQNDQRVRVDDHAVRVGRELQAALDPARRLLQALVDR